MGFTFIMYKKQIKYFSTNTDTHIGTVQEMVNRFLLSVDCLVDIKMQEYYDGLDYQVSFFVIYEKSI